MSQMTAARIVTRWIPGGRPSGSCRRSTYSPESRGTSEPLIAPGMRVLDVGCGPAVIAAELAGRFPVEVVALDASAARIDVARENFEGHANAVAVVGDAHSLPFDGASFNLVYSRFLFEYLADKQSAARELARVCCTRL